MGVRTCQVDVSRVCMAASPSCCATGLQAVLLGVFWLWVMAWDLVLSHEDLWFRHERDLVSSDPESNLGIFVGASLGMRNLGKSLVFL